MITLYKFRSLGTTEDYRRVVRILDTGEFWCSKLWDLNDPMEGMYTSAAGLISPAVVSQGFSDKNNRVICSFSATDAIALPTMWGYYANGFKGIAIAIEVDESEVHMVTYSPDVAEWVNSARATTPTEQLQNILTTKLTPWSQEAEYRFITESDSAGWQQIGRVTGVHFGWPYADVTNLGDIRRVSKPLRDYIRRARELRRFAVHKSIPCLEASISGTTVVSVQLTNDVPT